MQQPTVTEIKLLKEAYTKGIIDLEQLDNTLRMIKEKEYLSEHKNKIWQGKNRYWYTKLNGRLIKKKGRATLEYFLIEYYKKLDSGNDPSFEEVYFEWVESRSKYNEIKPSSILRYKDDYKRYFERSDFKNLPVREIDDLVLDDFVRTTIAKYSLTAKAYSCFRTIVIGVMKYAKRCKYTDYSVSTFFKDFQIPKTAFKKGSTKRKYIYSKSERRQLYEYCMSNPTIENLGIAFVCLTGLRVGELASLKHEDNISSCKLYIHRTESRIDSDGKIKMIVQDTSKIGHDDTIIIPAAAQRIIDITKVRTHNDEYIFSNNGNRVTARMFRYHLKKACKSIEIPYRSPHQMRKTYASILLSSGIDEALIKKEMRHHDISTTRSYYQYVTESDSEEKDIINDIIGL